MALLLVIALAGYVPPLAYVIVVPLDDSVHPQVLPANVIVGNVWAEWLPHFAYTVAVPALIHFLLESV
mgnify:CR=1 FL=1